MPYLFVLSPFTVHIVYDLDRFGGNCVNRHAFLQKAPIGNWKLHSHSEGRGGRGLSFHIGTQSNVSYIEGEGLTAKNLAHKLNDVFSRG